MVAEKGHRNAGLYLCDTFHGDALNLKDKKMGTMDY